MCLDILKLIKSALVLTKKDKAATCKRSNSIKHTNPTDGPIMPGYNRFERSTSYRIQRTQSCRAPSKMVKVSVPIRPRAPTPNGPNGQQTQTTQHFMQSTMNRTERKVVKTSFFEISQVQGTSHVQSQNTSIDEVCTIIYDNTLKTHTTATNTISRTSKDRLKRDFSEIRIEIGSDSNSNEGMEEFEKFYDHFTKGKVSKSSLIDYKNSSNILPPVPEVLIAVGEGSKANLTRMRSIKRTPIVSGCDFYDVRSSGYGSDVEKDFKPCFV